MTTDAKNQIATWAPTVISAILLPVCGWLSVSLFSFEGQVLSALAELRVKVEQQSEDISEIRKRRDAYVTQNQLEAYVELQLLKHPKKK